MKCILRLNGRRKPPVPAPWSKSGDLSREDAAVRFQLRKQVPAIFPGGCGSAIPAPWSKFGDLSRRMRQCDSSPLE